MADDLKKISAKQVKVIPQNLNILSPETDDKASHTSLLANQEGGPSKNSTRQSLAYLYVGAFLAIIMLTLIGMFLRNYSIDNIKEVLLTESVILSGPLGFIIGFYFKEELEKKNS